MDYDDYEPSDIILSIIKFLSKHCWPKKYHLKWAMMQTRVIFSTVLNLVICSMFVRAFIPELNTAVFYAPLAVIEVICLAVECLLLRGVQANTVRFRSFIIVYKSLDFLFSAIGGGFMIYQRHRIDFEIWEQTSAVVITILDLIDPIEIVIAYFWIRS